MCHDHRKAPQSGTQQERGIQKVLCIDADAKTTAAGRTEFNAIDKFLDWNFNHRAKATFEWYRQHLQNFVSAHCGLEIENLRPHDIEQWSASPNIAI